jgi:hypothetical protein
VGMLGPTVIIEPILKSAIVKVAPREIRRRNFKNTSAHEKERIEKWSTIVAFSIMDLATH